LRRLLLPLLLVRQRRRRRRVSTGLKLSPGLRIRGSRLRAGGRARRWRWVGQARGCLRLRCCVTRLRLQLGWRLRQRARGLE